MGAKQVDNELRDYALTWARVLTAFAACVAALWLATLVEAVLVPVLAALFLAYLLDPAVDRFETRGVPRTAAIVLVLLATGLFIVGFLLFLYPTVAHLIAIAATDLPRLIAHLDEAILPWLEQTSGISMEQGGQLATGQLPRLADAAIVAVGELWGRAGGLVAQVINLVLIPILLFYFLRDFDRAKVAIAEQLPPNKRAAILDRLSRMDTVVGAWFRGQIQVAFTLAILYAVGLGVVFGMTGVSAGYGIAIGLTAGVLNVIPYFGFLVGFALATAIAALDGGWPAPVLGVWGTFLVVQTLEGYLITPKIVGDKVGLSPVAVLIALLVGGELFGVVGVLLALPVAGIVRVFWPDLLASYRGTRFFQT